ncbi:MAG: hypothetical protein K2G90_07755 [Muribaculaceae bacterium]|nr:hypothetical protein [Muribaculaceae bacterium]
MLKKILSVCIGLALCACSASSQKGKEANDSSNEKAYRNEFFSMKYPADWMVEEDINDMCDTIPVMEKGVRAMFYDPQPSTPFHVLAVQKSALSKLFDTPEEWRDLSIALKKYDDQYIAIIEEMTTDSIKFDKYPAASAGFVAVNEGGDTIIHKQWVVMVDSQLYYLNNSFPLNDDGTLEKKGDDILSTLKFRMLSSDL